MSNWQECFQCCRNVRQTLTCGRGPVSVGFVMSGLVGVDLYPVTEAWLSKGQKRERDTPGYGRPSSLLQRGFERSYLPRVLVICYLMKHHAKLSDLGQ